MKKYIVFDANCVLCTRLAREIQEKSKGELNVLSIHDDGTKALLDTAYPDGWNYAPHFLEVEQENVRGWTGLGVNYQLLKALGVRHAWHIWRLARREGVNRKNKPSQFLFNRRQFMKTGFVTILASTLIASKVPSAYACIPCDTCGLNCYGRPCRCTLPCCCNINNEPDVQGCTKYDCYDGVTGEYCGFFCSNCSPCGSTCA